MQSGDGHAQHAPGASDGPAAAFERRDFNMSGFAWRLKILLSHWRWHPMQLAMLLIGLICATALWSGVQR